MNKQSLAYSFVPPFLRFYLSVFKQQLNSNKYKSLLQQNSEIRNKFKAERCFVIGTAPTIKDFDLKLIKGENIIAINEFYRHPDFEEIFNKNPKGKFILIPPLHPPFEEDELLKIFQNVEKQVSPEIGFFMGIDNYKNGFVYLKNKYNVLSKNTLYYYFAGIQCLLGYYTFKNKHWDITKPVWSAGTGSVYALIVALFLGFSEIYLLGIDHSYLNYSDYSKSRFYDTTIKNLYAEIENTEKLHNSSQNTLILKGTHHSFEQYAMMQKISDSKIINLSPKSIIDIFERKEYSDIVKEHLK